MKSLLLLSFLALASGNSAIAGSAQAELECKSASGRTTITGTVPGDSAEIAVALGVDRKSYTFVNPEMKEMYEINNRRMEEEYPGAYVAPFRYSMDHRNFYLETSLNDEALGMLFLKLESVPGTSRYKKIPNGEKGSFRAVLNGSDPRANPGERLPAITVNCTYFYQI